MKAILPVFLFFSAEMTGQNHRFFQNFGSDIVARFGVFGVTEHEMDNFGNKKPRESNIFLHTNIALSLTKRIYVGYSRRHEWDKIGKNGWEYFPMDGGFVQIQLFPNHRNFNFWLETGIYSAKYEVIADKTVKSSRGFPYSCTGFGLENRLKDNLFWHIQWLFQDKIDRKKGFTQNTSGVPVIGLSYHIFTRRTAKTKI
jgi:hypothetical protein